MPLSNPRLGNGYNNDNYTICNDIFNPIMAAIDRTAIRLTTVPGSAPLGVDFGHTVYARALRELAALGFELQARTGLADCQIT
jgi:hypothetical protein